MHIPVRLYKSISYHVYGMFILCKLFMNSQKDFVKSTLNLQTARRSQLNMHMHKFRVARSRESQKWSRKRLNS